MPLQIEIPEINELSKKQDVIIEMLNSGIIGKDEILTTEKVAEILALSTQTICQMARSGELPGKKIAEKWRFSRRLIEQWIRGERTEEKIDK